MNNRPTTWRRSTRSTWTFTLVIAVIACSWVAMPRPAAGAAPDHAPQAATALAWLARQLDDHGGTMPGFTAGSTEWGLTMDAVLAFGAAGTHDPAAIAATDRIATAEAVATYTTWDPGVPGVRVAGATAKTVLALMTMGRSTTVEGVDLEAQLRSLVVGSGVQRGRVVDQVPDPAWDASNGFSQALAILALSMTPGGVPPWAIDFLVAQQCPTGGFPLSYSITGSCTDDASADPDASALAMQALLAVERTAPVRAALDRGASWLLSRQGSDGSFGGAGPTAGANANSTGVIAQTLRAAGATDAADRAATWITSRVQLDATSASGTPAADQVGAIAYAPGARSTALTEGITEAAADQWRRSTTQAVLALGLAPYGPQDVEPLAPVSATTTTVTPTTAVPTTAVVATTVAPATTSPTSTGPTSTAPTTGTPSSAATGAGGPSAEVAQRTTDVGGSLGARSSAASASGGPRSRTGALPRTGSDTEALGAVGLASIGAGAMLLLTRRRHPRTSAGRR
jgi:LPXTG-motif cell wall-anchored protein